MITLVIGHRGTGKTELMSRMRMYRGYDGAEFVDLDTEIEKKIGRPIPEIFMEHGETYFRDLEQQIFIEILQKPYRELYLVLGAGFDVTKIPADAKVLWVRRRTDLDGRIFLDRPRLNPDLSPLEEFQKRALARELAFRDRADEIYLMAEGDFQNRHQAMAVEKDILLHHTSKVGGILTILPEVFKTERRWNLFKERYLDRGVQYFELRDDLFSLDDILKIMRELHREHFIFSFRRLSDFSSLFSDEILNEILSRASLIDWAWELGNPDAVLSQVPSDKLILSLHDHMAFAECLAYESKVGHIKYAPIVSTYGDLRKGHEWQRQKPQSRSFLPRSETGRWGWYRLLQKSRQLINFWREGDGSAVDQPSLWQWMMTPDVFSKFAAVLGEPVVHSYTPLEHSDFFYKRNLPVFAISIGREEWSDAIFFLTAQGLSYAAVTAPHKENAAKLCKHENLHAVNTLFFDMINQKWVGTSTDEEGFLQLIEGIGLIAPLQSEIAVWGGGGTLEMLVKSLPQAQYFSSRMGQPRGTLSSAETYQPKILIWAAPRNKETQIPPSSWKPKMVFDLNYKEDSMGREYAQRAGSKYESGLVMFKAQAQGQRRFWSQCEENT